MRWLSVIFALIGLTSICAAAPAGSPTVAENLQSEPIGTDTATAPSSSSSYSSASSSASSSLSLARKLPSHDVGLPSELAWQAWLVVANKPDAQSSFESATVPRRISPKSVFVAPHLQTACPDGYLSDSMGRCIRETIQINYKSHLEFILDRLRAKFPSTVEVGDSSAADTEPKESAGTGPLQVNISLGIEDNLSASRSPLSSEKSEREVNSDDSVEISVVHVPGKIEPLRSVRKPDIGTEADLTVYEVGNGTENAEDKEGTFFLNSSSLPLRDHSTREAVVPVAEFFDDGNRTFTEVIDYEIPLGRPVNVSRDKPFALAKNITETKPADDGHQPTVVLLLSPTTSTGAAASTPYFKDADTRPGISADHVLVRTGNLAVDSTGKLETPVNVTEPNLPSEETADEKDGEATPADDGSVQTVIPEFPDTVATTSYPEEEPDDATDSDDEILAHGEAGMLVSAGKFGPSIHPEESVEASSTAVVFPSGKTVEEYGGNISSESSISGDVIVETTLLDLNTGTTTTHANFDDLRELFEVEKDLGLEPEVVFSPQDTRRPSTRGKKRAEDHTVPSPATKESFFIDMGDSSALDSAARETVPRGESEEDPAPSVGGHLQQRRRTAPSQDHVRFPEDPRQPSPSYVLFPSDHSNSINGNLNYEERAPLAEEGTRPQSMPKNSVTLHQKKTYWHLPPGWRIDDPQPPRQPVALQNGNQRQNPMLFRFWTRMPLFRDPSLTTSNQSSRGSPIVNQRESIYRGISPQAVNRVFGQTVRRGGEVTG